VWERKSSRASESDRQSFLTSRRKLEKYMAGVEASESVSQTGHFESARLLDLLGADGVVPVWTDSCRAKA
jgi:hypothetical protein